MLKLKRRSPVNCAYFFIRGIDLKKNDKKVINNYITLKRSAVGQEWWKETVGSKGEHILKKLIETLYRWDRHNLTLEAGNYKHLK